MTLHRGLAHHAIWMTASLAALILTLATMTIGAPTALAGRPARVDPMAGVPLSTQAARELTALHARERTGGLRQAAMGAAPSVGHQEHHVVHTSARTVTVGGGPTSVAVDQATHTAYVANGDDGTISVVNTATCNSVVMFGCAQTPPTVAVTAVPVDLAIDQATDTIYVASLGGHSVAVISGKTCNASVSTGCSQTPATVGVGNSPDGIAVNEATDTIYASNDGLNADNSGHTVSVINGATCNGQVTAGCDQRTPSVQVDPGPAVPAINEATDTVYVPSAGPSGAGSVSVIDGKTCNGSVHAGCHAMPAKANVGPGSVDVAIDQATDTVYEPAFPTSPTVSLGSLFVINGATCDSTITSGCGQSSPAVTVGASAGDAVVDPITHSVFVTNQDDNTMSVVNAATCNAIHRAGCDRPAPVMTTGYQPSSVDVAVATDTLYVVNQADNDLTILAGAACSLGHQAGCRHAALTSAVGNGPAGVAVDRATDTIYVSNQVNNTLSVINGALCNASSRAGCRRTWPTIAVGNFPYAVVVDQRTDTVYVTNGFDNTVSVVNGATCNAHVNSGCGQSAPTIPVGGFPFSASLDTTTNTLYVANASDNNVSVINVASCNARAIAGCDQTPPVVAAGSGTFGVTVDQATNTVYASNNSDGTVSVIDGATCDAADQTGCGQSAPVVAVGPNPTFLAIDRATNTVYVTDDYFDATPSGSVSVIDGATCNSSVTSGCDRTTETLVTRGFPNGLTVDQHTRGVYVSTVGGADVEVFNGTLCDATQSAGCQQTPVSRPTGGWPSDSALDSATHTFYVADNVDGEVSLFAPTR